MSLQYSGNVDRMTVTLGSSYTAASGTMSLTTDDGAKLPSSGDFWLVTTSEIYRAFKCTARDGDTLTVTAGQDGTDDGNLDADTELMWSLTASALDQLRADLCVRTTVTNKPTAAKEGVIWMPSDGISIARDSGSQFHDYGPIYPAGSGVPSTGWSAFGDGGETVTYLEGGMQVVSPTSSGTYLYTRSIAQSAPYSVVVLLTKWWRFQDDMRLRAGLLESTGSKTVQMVFGKNTLENPFIAVSNLNALVWSSDAYLTTDAGATKCPIQWTNHHWMKFSFDGTNLSFYLGPDGVYWDLVVTVAKGDFITNNPDKFVWGVSTGDARKTVGTMLLYREEDDS